MFITHDSWVHAFSPLHMYTDLLLCPKIDFHIYLVCTTYVLLFTAGISTKSPVSKCSTEGHIATQSKHKCLCLDYIVTTHVLCMYYLFTDLYCRNLS